MRYLQYILFIGLIQNAITHAVHAQSVSGIITEATTGSPLELANVFLANSSIGDVSDKVGFYDINNIPLGRYDIIVSVIGYEKEKVKISITKSINITIDFKLEKKVIELPDVTVSVNPSVRKRQLKKFIKNFLGNSQNGDDSKIKNKDVIRFNAEESGVLKAYAYEPIEIINNSLGYSIYYVLEDFVLTSRFIRYTGYPHFTELTPRTPKDSTKWTENRAKTYKGSMRHFLTTICKHYEQTKGDRKERDYTFDWGDLIKYKVKVTYTDSSLIENQGFYVLQVDNPFIRNQSAERQLVNTNWFLTPAEQSHEMYLKFNDYLEVRYDDELYPFNNLLSRNKRVSWITLTTDSTILDKQGCYFDLYSINTAGIWSKERVADMLPYDYSIDD
jgi:hypothetical protein